MKSLNVVAAAVLIAVSGSVLAQSYSTNPFNPAIYDPSKGPLPMDRRFVMTREGTEEARYNAQNPPALVATTSAPASPTRKTYALPERSAPVMASAPDWFVRLPDDAENMMFAAGTATSTDEQMAYDKARMHAERKLVEIMSSRISTQTRSYRTDNTGTLSERYQQVTRKNARGELIGAQRVDSQITHDGQVYKVYVLLRLPLGTANTLQTQQIQAKTNRAAEIRAQAAERDMDAQEAREQRQQQEADAQLRQNLAPQRQAPASNTLEQQGQVIVTPISAPTANGTELRLLDVDNVEYKRRRDEALQKPGAVVGQTVLR